MGPQQIQRIVLRWKLQNKLLQRQMGTPPNLLSFLMSRPVCPVSPFVLYTTPFSRKPIQKVPGKLPPRRASEEGSERDGPHTSQMQIPR